MAGVNIDAPIWRNEALPQAGENDPLHKIRVVDASVWANVFARINIFAPVGSYAIDGIALDYYARGLLHFGILSASSQVIDGCETTGEEFTTDDAVWLVRLYVVTGAHCGIYLLEDQSNAAERLEVTRSHFDDLQAIKAMIRRDGLERVMIRRRDGRDGGDEIQDLFAAFEKIDVAIDNYLKAYEPRKAKVGNRDYLSSVLINSILRLWYLGTTCLEASSRIDIIQRLKDDIPSLIPLLAAAWRDLQFPIEDGCGNTREPLEEWFRNRLLREFEYDQRRGGNLPCE
jgi:hypothetical protein